MCDIDLDGQCDVWRETTRTARKQHKCSSCGGVISSGEKYIEHFDIFEGESNTERCCMACDADRQEFCAAHNVMLGPNSWEHYLSECIYDGGHDEDGRKWGPMLKRQEERRKLAKAV